MADQSEQINRLLRKEPGAAISQDEMGAMLSKGVPADQDRFDLGSSVSLAEQYPDEAEAFRNMTRQESGAAIPNSEMQAFMDEQLNMINATQQGLMEVDPQGTRGVVEGLELTKNKVLAGGSLSEEESTGIMAILQKLGGALSGMMGGGETRTYMVDGKAVEMTEREVMGAKNAGILVQDMESGIQDSEMGTYMVDGNPVQMTPMQYQDAVESGGITPNR